MPGYEPGDALSAAEATAFETLVRIIRDVDCKIPRDAIEPDRTLWDLGYDSLALMPLREQIEQSFGLQSQPHCWFQLHREHPRLGCLARFLVSGGAATSFAK